MQKTVTIIALLIATTSAAGVGLANYLVNPPERTGTHWHANGCPGQGDNVYHADHLDEFPEGCKEFILVDDKTDQRVSSFWADEIR